MIVKAQNILTQTAQYTFSQAAEAMGAGSIRVKNSDNFSGSWAIQIGNTGEQQAEIKLGTTTTGGTMINLIGTCEYPHPTDTPVYFIKYNQAIFYKSTAGTSGTISALATVNITPNSEYTQYDDTTGLTTDAYKVRWYNGTLSLYSNYSSWIIPEGYSNYALATMRNRAKNKLESVGFIKNDDVIDEWINEYLEVLNNIAIDINKDYALGSTQVGFSGTAQIGTITATDYKDIRRVWYTENGTDWMETKRMNITDFIPDQTFTTEEPYFYMYGDNIIGRQPCTTSGTFSIIYYKILPQLQYDIDELPVSMRSYTRGFVDYAVSQAYALDNRDTEAQGAYQKAMSVAAQFKGELSGRHKEAPQNINITDPISAEDGFDFIT